MRPTFYMVLADMHERLLEALAESENWGWHHADAGTPEQVHYQSLVRQLSHLDQKMKEVEDATKDIPPRGPRATG